MSSSYVPVESLLQSRAFRRLLVVSLLGHVLVYGFLLFRPSSHATLIAAAPVMVQMVDMPKAPPAPPAARPPAPPPPPPKPVVKEIVIPKEPAPLPAKPKPKPPPPSAEELLAKMTQRVEQQEASKAPPAPPAPPAAAPGETTGAQAPGLPSAGAFDPLMSPWIARVQVFVRQNWSGASVCEGKTPPVFNFDIDSAGHLSNIELAESSGNSFCDSTGERALRKSDPLPPPPRPGQLQVALNPKEPGQ